MTFAPKTGGYVLNHTMLRIKNHARVLAFYCDALGMTLLDRYDFENRNPTNTFNPGIGQLTLRQDWKESRLNASVNDKASSRSSEDVASKSLRPNF